MKFDLFDAINIVNKEFGEDSEILIRKKGYFIIIRISVFLDDEFHHTQFIIRTIEIESDEYVRIMNYKFNRSLKELRMVLDGKK